MTLKKYLNFILISLCTINSVEAQDSCHELFYIEPAQQWMETLPLGNGRLGMMPDGATQKEHIVLNEISMWTGSEADYSNPEAGKSLPEIRNLFFEGKNIEAQNLMYEKFVPRKDSDGATYGKFQILADLYITYNNIGEVTNYRRGLDLSKAVAYTNYTQDGVEFKRSYFVSHDKDVMIIHLASSKEGSLNFSLDLSRPNSEKSIINKKGQLEL